MPVVNQGSPTTVTLEVGETMRVVADANSNGIVRRSGDRAGFQRSGVQQQSIPAGATRIFGPFPSIRHYSIEVAVGSLTYTSTIDDFAYSTIFANVEGFSGNRTLMDGDNGKLLRCDDGSAVTITVPNNLAEGFNIGVAQWGAGAVTIAAASGATKRSAAASPSAQYKVGALLVVKNSDGASAEFTFSGEVT